MEKSKKIAAIAMLISVLNCSQSHASCTEMSWSDLKANSAAGETTKKYYMGTDKNKIKYECMFDNNKENGDCKEFYKNGKVAKETKSTDNGKTVAYKTFFENGEPATEGQYTNGKKNGLFKQYYWHTASALPSSQLSSESSYKNGVLNGMSKKYSPKGTVTWSQNYN